MGGRHRTPPIAPAARAGISLLRRALAPATRASGTLVGVACPRIRTRRRTRQAAPGALSTLLSSARTLMPCLPRERDEGTDAASTDARCVPSDARAHRPERETGAR